MQDSMNSFHGFFLLGVYVPIPYLFPGRFTHIFNRCCCKSPTVPFAASAYLSGVSLRCLINVYKEFKRVNFKMNTKVHTKILGQCAWAAAAAAAASLLTHFCVTLQIMNILKCQAENGVKMTSLRVI